MSKCRMRKRSRTILVWVAKRGHGNTNVDRLYATVLDRMPQVSGNAFSPIRGPREVPNLC
eukprot:4586075-Pyramimonas_sp.AAC.1